MDPTYRCDSSGDTFNTSIGRGQHMRTCRRCVEDAGAHLWKCKAALDAQTEADTKANERKHREEDK